MNDHFELLIMGQQFKKLYEKCYGHIMQTYGLKKIDIDVLYFLSHSGKQDTAKDIAIPSPDPESLSSDNLHRHPEMRKTVLWNHSPRLQRTGSKAVSCYYSHSPGSTTLFPYYMPVFRSPVYPVLLPPGHITYMTADKRLLNS